MRRLMSLVLGSVLLCGCGADRLRVPDIGRPFVQGAPRQIAVPAAGLRFEAPGNWIFAEGQRPLVGDLSSGSATVAVWRYERTEPLPRSKADLEAATERLLGAIRVRDPQFRSTRSTTPRVDGARAVQVVGDGTVEGRPRRFRSTHVYAHGAEYVVDAYAAPADFALIDRVVFRPLLRSVRIDPIR